MVLGSRLWVKESGNVKGREKLIYWCMPLFLPYPSLPYVFCSSLSLGFLVLFLLGFFSLFFSLCVFFLHLPLVPLFFFFFLATVHGYIYPLYTCLNLWDFSLLSLRLYQPLLVSYGYLSRTTTNLLVARPLPLLRVCLLHHSPFPDKSSYFVSLSLTTLPPLSG